MPNRILKESICVSDSIDSLTWFEEVLFYRLMVNCDDYGRFDGRVSVIKNRLFPLKDALTIKSVSAAIDKLVNAGLVALYEFEGKPYLHLPTWNEHQNVRAKRSKYPAPEDCTNVNTSAFNCNQMRANVPVIQSVSESESLSVSLSECESKADKPPARPRFVPPSADEVREYCREKGYTHVDPDYFVNYYASKGWMVGKNKMKDWKAAVSGWESRDKSSRKENDWNKAHGVDKLRMMYEEEFGNG